MKIESREDLERALEMLVAAWLTGTSRQWKAHQEAKREILDALFPKPESERLKALRFARTAINRNDLIFNLLHDGHLNELIDDAIKEEEAKS